MYLEVIAASASRCDTKLISYVLCNDTYEDEVAEWLRRWTANPMCSARVGSNPILVVDFYSPFPLGSFTLFPFFSTGMHKR